MHPKCYNDLALASLAKQTLGAIWGFISLDRTDYNLVSIWGCGLFWGVLWDSNSNRVSSFIIAVCLCYSVG